MDNSIQKEYDENPPPSNLTKKAIGRIAYLLAEKLEFKPGDPVEPIIKRLGGRIHYSDDWEYFDNETIKVHGVNDFDVYISNFTSPQRDRFTIAHELGHYVLHSSFGEKRIRANRKHFTGILEWESNWFAAAFLMPSKEFEEAVAKYKDDVSSLAAYFNVSVQAIRVRTDNYCEY